MKNQSQKPPFHNLHTLLSTTESRGQLSEATGIHINRINDLLDPDKQSIPKTDSLVIVAKYFGCTVDYLLDLSGGR